MVACMADGSSCRDGCAGATFCLMASGGVARYDGNLRQLWAVVLLVAFSFGLIGPLLSAEQREAKLPPCCRRDGKHRCAMMDAAAGAVDDGAAGIRSGEAKCPLYPAGKSVPVSLVGAVPLAGFGSLYLPLTRRVVARPDAVQGRSFESCSARKRGPPSVHS